MDKKRTIAEIERSMADIEQAIYARYKRGAASPDEVKNLLERYPELKDLKTLQNKESKVKQTKQTKANNEKKPPQKAAKKPSPAPAAESQKAPKAPKKPDIGQSAGGENSESEPSLFDDIPPQAAPVKRSRGHQSPWPEGTELQRINVFLPVETARIVKAAAVMRGQDLGVVLDELIRENIKIGYMLR